MRRDDLSEPEPLTSDVEWAVDFLTPHQALEFYLTSNPEDRRTMRNVVRKKILQAPQPAPWTPGELRQLRQHLGISSLSVPGHVDGPPRRAA